MAFGIDFGTCFSRAAVLAGRSVQLVRDADGSIEFPAVVAFDGAASSLGRSALVHAASDPGAALRCVKRWLGRTIADDLPFEDPPREIEAASDGGILVRVGEHTLSAIDVAARVLGALADCAARQTGERPSAVALAVPSWLGTRGVKDLCGAAACAGLAVLPPVSDATACAVALAAARPPSERLVAIVDVGAGGISASIALVGPASAIVVAEASDGRSGGEAIDRALIEQVRREIEDPRAEGTAGYGGEKLRQACERLKIALSDQPAASVSLDFLAPGATFSLQRSQLEVLLGDLLERVTATCERCLADAGLSRADIQATYATGGMTRVPAVRACIELVFPGPLAALPHPDGSVALGAALVAAMQAGEIGAIPIHRATPAPRLSALPPPLRSSFPDSAIPQPSRPPPAASRSTRPPPPGSIRPAAGVLPREVGSGRFVRPPDVRSVLGLALVRPLAPEDLSPVALAVLFARVLRREHVRGVLELSHAGKSVDAVAVDGRACLTDIEHNALTRAFAWPEGQYTFQAKDVATGSRHLVSWLRVAVGGLRVLARSFSADEMAEALGTKLDLAPVVRQERSDAVTRLGLVPAEKRTLDLLDGATSGRALERSGVGRHTTLGLLVMLSAFDTLEWREPVRKARETLAQVLERRMIRMLGTNHFEALGVHWSAPAEAIAQAYHALVTELAAGGHVDRAAPSTCAKMRERARQAYDVLSDPKRRIAHRREAYPLDYEALSELMEKRADALEMKQAEEQASADRAVAGELSRTGRPKPPT